MGSLLTTQTYAILGGENFVSHKIFKPLTNTYHPIANDITGSAHSVLQNAYRASPIGQGQALGGVINRATGGALGTLGRTIVNTVLMPGVASDSPQTAAQRAATISNFNRQGNNNFANQAAEFGGGLAAVNPLAAGIRLGNNLGNIGTPKDLINNPGQTAGAFADYAINRFTGKPEIGIIDKFAGDSALKKLIGYGTVRGLENVGATQARSLMDTGKLDSSFKDNANAFGTGFALNTVLSPKLSGKALVESSNVVSNLVRNIENKGKLKDIANKLYAPVENTTNRASTGKFSGSRDAGNYTRQYTESNFVKSVDSKEGLSRTIDPTYSPGGAKVTVTFNSKGEVIAVHPDRPEFAQYIEDAARGTAAAPPKGTESVYKSLKATNEPLPTNLSLEGAQFRSKPKTWEEALKKWDSDLAAYKKKIGAVGHGEDREEIDNLITEFVRKNAPKKSDYAIPEKVLPTSRPNEDVSTYVRKQVEKQQAAASSENSVLTKLKDLQQKLKSGFVDSQAAIEDNLTRAEKQGGFEVRPQNDVRLQQGKVRRADQLASQFIHDNGLADVIKNAPNLDEFNQYLIARHAADVEKAGFKTGRDSGMDQKLVSALGGTYEGLAKQVDAYTQKYLDYAVEAGLVSKETAAMLKEKYPNYVPIDRIFSEGEQALMKPPAGTGKGAMASQGSQTAVRSLKGSEREISNPLETLLTRTKDVFQQGERNKAAQMVVDYEKLPGNPFQLRELAAGENATGKSTISVMENGVKKVYETTPEIATAAKNLNKQQLGLVGSILGAATRVFKVGTTGLRLPFAAANLAKDQVTAFINSDRALSTSVANPLVFLKGFAEAIGKGELFQEMQRSGGGGTSLDLFRNAAPETVNKLRAERSLASKALYTVTHPKELFRAAEDIINITEQATRAQQYIGTKQALLREGRTEADATLLAAKAARENTTDFARSGSYGQVLNSTIPYLNAGIQGSRTFLAAAKRNPDGVAAKIALTVFTPVLMTTIWNTSDPERKKAYDDIADYEKEGNMIIVPPNPTQDPKTGKWNVIKIPLSQEVANLGSIVRRGIESAQGGDPLGIAEVANDLFQTATSLDTNPRKVLSQITPQVLKAPIEAATNQNLFTGAKIIPDSLKNLPPEYQVKDSTSAGAKLVGNALGISPLVVNNTVGDIFGGLGTDILNQKNPIAATDARFTEATGGKGLDKIYSEIDQVNQDTAVRNLNLKKQLVTALKSGDTQQLSQAIAQVPFDSRSSFLAAAQKEAVPSTLSKTQQLLADQNRTMIEALLKKDPSLGGILNDPAVLSNASFNPAVTPAASLGSSGAIKTNTSLAKGLRVSSSRGRRGGKVRSGHLKAPHVSKQYKAPKSVTIHHAGSTLRAPKFTSGAKVSLPRFKRGNSSARRSLRRNVRAA